MHVLYVRCRMPSFTRDNLGVCSDPVEQRYQLLITELMSLLLRYQVSQASTHRDLPRTGEVSH